MPGGGAGAARAQPESLVWPWRIRVAAVEQAGWAAKAGCVGREPLPAGCSHRTQPSQEAQEGVERHGPGQAHARPGTSSSADGSRGPRVSSRASCFVCQRLTRCSASCAPVARAAVESAARWRSSSCGAARGVSCLHCRAGSLASLLLARSTWRELPAAQGFVWGCTHRNYEGVVVAAVLVVVRSISSSSSNSCSCSSSCCGRSNSTYVVERARHRKYNLSSYKQTITQQRSAEHTAADQSRLWHSRREQRRSGTEGLEEVFAADFKTDSKED